MGQQLDIVHYAEALKILESNIIDVKPIKKTAFITEHKLDARIFKVMEEMGILEVMGASKLGGTIYDWKYTKASNATATHLATRVTAAIYDLNQQAYAHYNSEEYRKKKAKKDFKEQERERALAPHAKDCRCSVCRMKGHTPLEQLIAQTKDHDAIHLDVAPIIEYQEPIAIEQPVIEQPAPEPKKELTHKTVNFKLEGDLTKEEIIEKLGILLSNKPISAFEISVIY